MIMPYTIIIENKAQKEFLKLPRSHIDSVKKAINNLEKEPRPQGSKKLSGKDDGYRIRVGDFRILYSIDDSRKLVTIYHIRHRREAYR
jgi:mRNA interferase RelE/StbE